MVLSYGEIIPMGSDWPRSIRREVSLGTAAGPTALFFDATLHASPVMQIIMTLSSALGTRCCWG